jgi:hypothetical protein
MRPKGERHQRAGTRSESLAIGQYGNHRWRRDSEGQGPSAASALQSTSAYRAPDQEVEVTGRAAARGPALDPDFLASAVTEW